MTNNRSLAGSKADISAPFTSEIDEACAKASVWVGVSDSRLATVTLENDRASTPARSCTVAVSLLAEASAKETRTGCAASSADASLSCTWLLATCTLLIVAALPLVTVNWLTEGRLSMSSGRSKYRVITSPSPSTLALISRTALWLSRCVWPTALRVVTSLIACWKAVWVLLKAVRSASISARTAVMLTPPTVGRAATWSINVVARVPMPVVVSALSPSRSARVEKMSRAMSSRCASPAPVLD